MDKFNYNEFIAKCIANGEPFDDIVSALEGVLKADIEEKVQKEVVDTDWRRRAIEPIKQWLMLSDGNRKLAPISHKSLAEFCLAVASYSHPDWKQKDIETNVTMMEDYFNHEFRYIGASDKEMAELGKELVDEIFNEIFGDVGIKVKKVGEKGKQEVKKAEKKAEDILEWWKRSL